MRVLVVEDDPLLGDGLEVGLRQAGWTVDWIKDGLAADRALSDDNFDAVVLDLALPRMSGLTVLSELRRRGDATPVIVLTAFDEVSDRVHGLDTGADDYLVKPFDLDELAARLRALLRRGGAQQGTILADGALALDPASRAARLGDEQLKLTPIEFALLEALLREPGRVIARERLQLLFYGWADETESNTLEVHIHHLRRKIGRQRIETARGMGYRLVPQRQNP